MPFSVIAQKEKVHFTKIGAKEGLPQSHVFGLSQDTNGYVWVCTMGGLGKYNGNHFVNYTNDLKDSTSISSSWIYKYFEDTKGRSYVATNNGFNEFNKEKGTFTRYFHSAEVKHSLLNNKTRDLIETQDGEIGIATGSGVSIFDPETKLFFNYTHPKFNYNRHSPCLLYDTNNELWAGADNGLYQVVKGQEELKYYPLLNDEGKELSIYNLLQDSNGTIWVGSSEGLYIFSAEHRNFQHVDYGDANQSIRALLEYPKGNLYIATVEGLFYWDSIENKILSSYTYSTSNPEGISLNNVYSLMKDRDNNIWMGLFKGINIINPEDEIFKLYINETGLNNPKNTILKVYSDSKERVWLNTIDGFYVIENINSEPIEILFPPSFKKGFKNIREIIEDAHGDIWVSNNDDGLYKTINQSTQFIEVETLEHFNDNAISHIVLDNADTNILWVPTSSGLCSYSIKTRDTSWVFPTKWGAENNHVGSLTQHEDGSLWFVNSRKLSVYYPDENRFKSFNTNPNDSLAWFSGGAQNIVATKDRIYLSGSSFSYFDIEKEVFTNFTKYNTPGEYKVQQVLSVQEAQNGTIWFTGGSSLWEFNPKTNHLNYFNVSLDGDGFITYSSNATHQGKLLFGANNGVFEVDPENLKENSPPSNVVLSSFKVSNEPRYFDKEIQFVKDINLSKEDNIFTIEYTALQFTNEEILNYQYKLEGFDDTWMNAEFKNEVTYTNLDPGNYTFIVEAINSQGLKSEKPLVLTIYIEPAFWQTNSFYAGLFLLFSSIVFLIYLNRKKVQKLRQDKLVAEKNTIYKSKFLANMSHEFRTPMNAIMGLNKLMLDSNLSEKQRKYVEGIDHSCENLLWIINDFLDNAKIESGKLSIRVHSFNINKITDQIQVIFDPKIKEKNLNLHISVDPEIPALISGDSTRLFQILANLIGNAIKFTSEGYVKLSIVKKIIENDEITLLFKVEDTGIGIPENKQSIIFESFEQIYVSKESESISNQGTGLGLTIAKELVERMGGAISVSSKVTVGSTFSFTLPFTVASKIKTTETQEALEVTNNNLHVLLVEDTPLNEFLATELLTKHFKNIRIDVAQNGAIACKKINSKVYNLVLMDVKMPVMDGIEATKIIRQKTDSYFKKIPIIGLTANAIPEQIKECMDAGMNECVTKPIVLNDLLAKINASIA